MSTADRRILEDRDCLCYLDGDDGLSRGLKIASGCNLRAAGFVPLTEAVFDR